MAQSKAEIDLDAAHQPAGNKKHLVLYLIIVLLVVGLGATIALLLTNKEPAGEAEKSLTVKPAAYLPLKPFVVNFAEQGPARFLQVEVQVMAFDPAILTAVETHMPVIRNDVNLLLAAETFETVSTRDGKEKLREDVKKTIQRILGEQKVNGSVEAVYFTSFVMQ
jgi:flagellar FliL protein